MSQIKLNYKETKSLLSVIKVILNTKTLRADDIIFHNPLCNPLWDILSALRGPDFIEPLTYDKEKFDIHHIKRATTVLIRGRLGLLESTNLQPFDVSTLDSEDNVNTRKWLREHYSGYHFISHVMRAFETLGLNWDESNGNIKPISLEDVVKTATVKHSKKKA